MYTEGQIRSHSICFWNHCLLPTWPDKQEIQSLSLTPFSLYVISNLQGLVCTSLLRQGLEPRCPWGLRETLAGFQDHVTDVGLFQTHTGSGLRLGHCCRYIVLWRIEGSTLSDLSFPGLNSCSLLHTHKLSPQTASSILLLKSTLLTASSRGARNLGGLVWGRL